MCLTVNREKTEKLRQKKTGKVVMWKAVERKGPALHSMCCANYTWKAGWNKSNRQNTAGHSQSVVSKGIHVCTTRKKIHNTWMYFPGDRIIKVICYNKDLIAVDGHGNAAYTKVFVPKNEYDDALKRNGKEKRR